MIPINVSVSSLLVSFSLWMLSFMTEKHACANIVRVIKHVLLSTASAVHGRSANNTKAFHYYIMYDLYIVVWKI
jgi:hypothetical protein